MSSPLDAETSALVRVAAALGAGGTAPLEAALEEARAAAPPGAVEETLLQSYLFVGYPRVLLALGLWRERSPHPFPSPPERPEEWESRGERICAAVYGPQYEKLRENVRTLHPDLERWMITEGYGKVLGRPGPTLVQRELAVVAVLTTQRAYPQLHSHVRGALRVGASPDQVEAALELALAQVPQARDEVQALWDQVRVRGPEA